MATTLRDRWTNYTRPIVPLSDALWALRVAVMNAVRQQGIGALSNFSKLLDVAFAHWYQIRNEHILSMENMSAAPKLVATAEGNILELGPGLGNQLPRMDRSRIQHVYGVEPNLSFIPALRDKAAECGLEGKYTIIPCGVEDSDMLEKYGLEAGTIDTILSMQVLCSAPKPELVAKNLYRILRPGGKLIFWEHGRNNDWLTRIVQNVWNPPWACLMGGCNLNRDILAVVKAAGEWQGLDTLESDGGASMLLPHVWGTLVKPEVAGSRDA